MVKHTQTIRRLLAMNCLSVFDHFVGLTLKGLFPAGTSATSRIELGQNFSLGDRLV